MELHTLHDYGEPPVVHKGHTFRENTISSDRVHFGDINYYNSAKTEQTARYTDNGSTRPRSSSTLTGDSDKFTANELYLVLRRSIPQYVGRSLQTKIVEENLGLPGDATEDGKQRIVIVYGLGGSGKTQFCLRYAENHRNQYWGVFWIDASTRQNAEAGFASLALQAGKGAGFSAGKYWLSQCHRRWLLILDNADEPDLGVSDFFPAGNNGHILVTTRNPNLSVYATAVDLHFRGLEPEEAISLLLTSAYPRDDLNRSDPEKRRLARSIAVELGYLAIALDFAGATIRRKIYTLEKYLQFYLGYRHRIMKSPQPISADETNIITTWEIPFRKIEQRKLVEHQDAVVLMHILPFLHFESVPEALFTVVCNSTGEVGSQDDIPDLFRVDSSSPDDSEARLRRAVSVLSDYSIIDYDETQQKYSMHPVIHRWARTRLSDAVEISYWLDCTIRLLVRCISPYMEASGRNFRRSLMAHVDSCVSALSVIRPNFPQTRREADQAESFASLYAETGGWKPALSLQHKVITYRLRRLGRRHNDTLEAKRNLAQIYWNLFEVQSAIDLQTEILTARWWSRPSLAYWEPFMKPDYIEYCMALVDLTQSLWLAGMRDLSKRTGERAVDGLLKRIGPDDPRTLSAMFNLARTYVHLQEFDKGHKILVTVLQKRKRFFGLKHPDTLMTRNELGMSFCVRDKYLAIAERLVTNVLETRREVLGEEHAYTLWSVNDLSKVMCQRQRPSQAVEMLEQLIPIVQRTLGDSHVGMIMTKGNLARAYVRCGKLIEARLLLQEILSMIKDTHPDWLQAMSGLVRVQKELGTFDEAEASCRRILSKVASSDPLTQNNPVVVSVMNQLSQIQNLRDGVSMSQEKG